MVSKVTKQYFSQTSMKCFMSYKPSVLIINWHASLVKADLKALLAVYLEDHLGTWR